MITVGLVTSVGVCGIAEHSEELQRHVRNAAPDIGFGVSADWLDPQQFPGPTNFDVVHLNYHRGLHSRWTHEVIARYAPTPFVITFHDTYDVQPDDLPGRLLACPNVRAMVVHEPCDLQEFSKVHYWRQAVPERTGEIAPQPVLFYGGWRPTLGTLGFDFPWKNYDMLARVTEAAGWNLRVVGQVSAERQAQLLRINPRTAFDGFVPRDTALSILESCDASAFMYNCANSGTSGAIRVGLGAGKPVIATHKCRQFRDLQELNTGILWTQPTDEDLDSALSCVTQSAGPGGYDLDVVRFAHQERWPLLGEKYAQLYRQVCNG